MKILVISDTHGHEDNLKKVMRCIGGADYLIHCGDVCGHEGRIRKIAGCPASFVRGNCDRGSDHPKELVLDLDGVRVFVTHGHLYDVSWSRNALAEAARAAGAQIALYGHTHDPRIEHMEGGLTVANPGSLTLPRQDGREPSFLLAETDGKGQVLTALNYLRPDGTLR